MSRILKLGFAMGGGVSLGTFSGAALTEAIKLAILYGKDKDGNSYKDVEIDVFSGASAGSMSLCIMLRGLLYQSPEEKANAITKLSDEFNSDFNQLSDKKKKQLIAAQVTQDIQKKIWVDEVTIDRLLGKEINGEQTDLKYVAGILNRGTVDKIAKENFRISELLSDPSFSFDNRQLLGERVLYASSITNLTKIQFDARRQFSKSIYNREGLEDGLTSHGHTEMRIFDINFTPVPVKDCFDEKKRPSRWCRYHVGSKDEGIIGDLKKTKAWSKIIATSIASGAFQFAFEPVVLTRSDYEFGKLWPVELKNAGIKEYPFTYVDGGTFNNEPIREAFRLASFIDSNDNREYERRIIFVDPNAGEEPKDFRIPIHKKYKVEDPSKILGRYYDGYDIMHLSTLDRLIPQIGTVFNSIFNEAMVNENDKIYQVRNKFEDRKNLRSLINDTFSHFEPLNFDFEKLLTTINVKLDNYKTEMLIPPGTLTLPDELRRVIIEYTNGDMPLLNEIDTFLKRENKGDDPNAKEWLKYCYFILTDLLMDIAGKNENSEIIAIAPIIESKDGTTLEAIHLPGKLLSGFGGFLSDVASHYEFDLGKNRARFFLEKQNAIRIIEGGVKPHQVFSIDDEKKFKEEVKGKLKDLNVRVQRLISDSSLLNISPLVDKSILFFAQKYIRSIIGKIDSENAPATTFSFMIQVSSRKFELNGNRPFSDSKAILVEDKDGEEVIQLFTEAKYYSGKWTSDKKWKKSKRWEGIHIMNQDQLIRVDIDRGIRKDKSICTIELPGEDKIAIANLMPNPIFRFNRKLTENNRGEHFTQDNWIVESGVSGLETTLISDR